MPELFDLTEQYRNQLMSREDQARLAMLKDYRGVWGGLDQKIESAAQRIAFSEGEKADLAEAFKDDLAGAGTDDANGPAELSADKLSRFTDLLLGKNSWQELERDLDGQFRAVADNAAQVTETHRRALGQTAVDHAVKLMKAQLGKERVAGLSKEALEALNKKAKADVDEMWQQQRDNLAEIFRAKAAEASQRAREALRQETLHGLLVNAGAKQILGRVKQAIDDREAHPDRDPTLIRALHSEYRIATQNSYRESMRFTFSESGRVTQWRWTSARTAKTCALCWAMDGKVFPLETPLKSHPHCRCVPVPVVEDEQGNALRTTEREGGEVGNDAFTDIPPAQQKAILGAKAFSAYERGEFDLSDLIGVQFNTRFGVTLYRQSVDQAVERSAKRQELQPAPAEKPKPVEVSGGLSSGVISSRLTRAKLPRMVGKSAVNLSSLFPGSDDGGDFPQPQQSSQAQQQDDDENNEDALSPDVPAEFYFVMKGAIPITPDEYGGYFFGGTSGATQYSVMLIFYEKVAKKAGLSAAAQLKFFERVTAREKDKVKILESGSDDTFFKDDDFKASLPFGFKITPTNRLISALWKLLKEEIDAASTEVWFVDDANAQRPAALLRRYLQMNVFGPSDYFLEKGDRIAYDGISMGITPTSVAKGKNDDGNSRFDIVIPEAQKATLYRLIAKWRADEADQKAKNEKAVKEVNDTTVDLGLRSPYNMLIDTGEGTLNLLADVGYQQYAPSMMYNPFRPRFDFSGAKARLRSDYMNRDIYGEVNPDGITRGKAIETIVPALAPFALPSKATTVSRLPRIFEFFEDASLARGIPKPKIFETQPKNLPKIKPKEAPKTEVPGGPKAVEPAPKKLPGGEKPIEAPGTGNVKPSSEPVPTGKPAARNVKKDAPKTRVKNTRNRQVENPPKTLRTKKPVKKETPQPKVKRPEFAEKPPASTTSQGKQNNIVGETFEKLVENRVRSEGKFPFYRPKGRRGFDMVALDGEKIIIYEDKFTKGLQMSKFSAITKNFRTNVELVLNSLKTAKSLTKAEKLHIRKTLTDWLAGKNPENLSIKVVTGKIPVKKELQMKLVEELKGLKVEFEEFR